MSITASEVGATQRKNAGGIDGAMQTRSGDAGHGKALERMTGRWGKQTIVKYTNKQYP